MSERESNLPSWDDMLAHLKSLKADTGKVEVPKDKRDPSLEAWIQDQRRQYKALREMSVDDDARREATLRKNSTDKSSPHLLTLQRILDLEKVGFSWDMSHDMEWKKRYEQLKEYNTSHGHCMVPARCQQHPELGRWVMTQRRQYVLLKEGKPSRLTKERQRLLEEIGFVWILRENYQQGWQRRMKELKQFFEENGHYDVPHFYSENSDLGSWVRNLRIQHTRFSQGKRCTLLTKSRFAELNKMGFNWRSSSSTPTGSSQDSSSSKDDGLHAAKKVEGEGQGMEIDAMNGARTLAEAKMKEQQIKQRLISASSKSSPTTRAATVPSAAHPLYIGVYLPPPHHALGRHGPPDLFGARVLGTYPTPVDGRCSIVPLPSPHAQAISPYGSLPPRVITPRHLLHHPSWQQAIDALPSSYIAQESHGHPSMMPYYYLQGKGSPKRVSLLRQQGLAALSTPATADDP